MFSSFSLIRQCGVKAACHTTQSHFSTLPSPKTSLCFMVEKQEPTFPEYAPWWGHPPSRGTCARLRRRKGKRSLFSGSGSLQTGGRMWGTGASVWALDSHLSAATHWNSWWGFPRDSQEPAHLPEAPVRNTLFRASGGRDQWSAVATHRFSPKYLCGPPTFRTSTPCPSYRKYRYPSYALYPL